MTHHSPSEADKILDGSDEAAFGALLDAARAPSNGFTGVGLCDLAGRRAQVSGQLDRGADLARDLLGNGDGGALAALQNAPGAGPQIALEWSGLTVLLVGGDQTLRAAAGPPGRRLDLRQLRRTHQALADPDPIPPPGIKWVLHIDAASGALREARAEDESAATRRSLDAVQAQPELIALFADLLQGRRPSGASRAQLGAALIDADEKVLELRRLPFVPRLAVVTEYAGARVDGRLWDSTRDLAEDVLRELTGRILAAGLKTQMAPFPQTEVEFDRIVKDLRDLGDGDLDGRLVLGGFADHPVDGDDGSMRCRECIYYLPHRRWCDLPELPLPVEPDWYCRLWKL